MKIVLVRSFLVIIWFLNYAKYRLAHHVEFESQRFALSDCQLV